MRPARRAGRVTDRDLALLTWVGRARAVTTDILAGLFFGDRSTATRRLARLVGAGYLHVRAERLDEPNIYTLTERGLELLVGEGVEAESLFAGRAPKPETHTHLRHLNEFRAVLELACRARPDVGVRFFLADHDLRRLAGTNLPAYVPDVVFELERAGRAPLGLAGEIDLAQESAPYFARTKVRATVEAAAARLPLWGLQKWRPFVLVPSTARLRSLARAIDDEGGGNLWLASTFDIVRDRGVFGPAFTTIAEVVQKSREAVLDFPLRLVPSQGGTTP